MKRAFTLIELLIVVAIIAILAAIAVPNFLEAQVRSKVARVKADMRSIATALEAYAVDANHYPMGYWSRRSITNQRWHGPQRLSPLTTPVAYMTSIPFDPFIGPAGYHSGDVLVDRETFLYESTAPHMQPGAPGSSGTGLSGGYADLFYTANVRGIKWCLSSVGPNKESLSTIRYFGGDIASEDTALPYDATNGTQSRGMIHRTSLGDTNELLDAIPRVNAPESW